MIVRLVGGREVEVPAHADVDVMLDHLTSGRTVGEIAGEAVLFWAQVEPGPEDGKLRRWLVETCREELARQSDDKRLT